MRVPFAAVFISVALTVCNCGPSEAIESTLNLVGSIDNHNRVSFTLRSEGAALNGRVQIFEALAKPSSRAYAAKGNIDAQGNVVLEEYSGSRRRGTFTGRLLAGKVFVGTFRQAKSKDAPVPVLLRSASDRTALGRGEQGVIVIENKYTYKRQHPVGPHEQVEVSFPVVSGLADQALISKIQRTIRQKTKSGMSFSEFMGCDDTTMVSYEVNYNANYLLNLSILYEGLAAYDWSVTNYLLIDLRTGSRLDAKDVFVPSSLGRIRKLAEIQLQRSARQEIRDLSKMEPDMEAQGVEYLHRELPMHKFSLDDLDNFVVSDKGITFQYTWGFPHVIRCFEPNEQFFVPYTQLSPYIRKNGPLAIFVANGTSRERLSKAIK
jgi:hypothetical protein